MSLNITNKRYAVIHKDTLNNKDIVVTSNGNYFAEDGYTGLGLVRVQVPEPVYEEIIVNPSISQQIIEPSDGMDGITKVTVNPVTSAIDTDIQPENILKGINILGVDGNVEFITEDIIITPSTEVQTITPSTGKDGIYNIKVKAVTSSIDSNIKAKYIKSGVNILGVTGNLIESNETTRNIYQNGTYTPTGDYTGFSQVIVDVKVQHDELVVTPTTEVQTFTAVDDFHGYSPVTVNAVTSSIDENIIPSNIKNGISILGVTGNLETLNLTTKNITENGTYFPESPYNGFSQVSVNINTVNNTDITITEAGVYTPESPFTGFGTVTVDLSWIQAALEALNAGDADTTINLQDKTVTTAGTYTADAGFDGLGTVIVNLDWVTAAIEEAKQGTPDGTGDQLIAGTTTKITTDADQVRSYAFYYAPVETVILTSATSIGEYAFAYSSLKTLTISTSQVCTLHNEYCLPSTITTIYVPSNLVTSYKNDSYWSLFSNKIQAIS